VILIHVCGPNTCTHFLCVPDAPPILSYLVHPNNTVQGQFTKFFIMQFSPVSCNFLPLTSKYSLQRCLRQTGMVLPQCTRSSFTNVIKYLNKSLRKKVVEHSRVESAVTLAPLPFPIFCANAMLKNSAVLRRAVKYHIGNSSVPIQNPSKVSKNSYT